MPINDGSQSLTYFLTQKCDVFNILLAFLLCSFLPLIYLLSFVFFPFHYCPLYVPLLCFGIFNNSAFISIIPLLFGEIISGKSSPRSHTVQFLYFLFYFF